MGHVTNHSGLNMWHGMKTRRGEERGEKRERGERGEREEREERGDTNIKTEIEGGSRIPSS